MLKKILAISALTVCGLMNLQATEQDDNSSPQTLIVNDEGQPSEQESQNQLACDEDKTPEALACRCKNKKSKTNATSLACQDKEEQDKVGDNQDDSTSENLILLACKNCG